MDRVSKIETEKLMAAIPFNRNDLELNRQFELSENQKFRLKPIIDLYIFFSVTGTLICFVTTSIFLNRLLRRNSGSPAHHLD